MAWENTLSTTLRIGILVCLAVVAGAFIVPQLIQAINKIKEALKPKEEKKQSIIEVKQ